MLDEGIRNKFWKSFLLKRNLIAKIFFCEQMLDEGIRDIEKKFTCKNKNLHFCIKFFFLTEKILAVFRPNVFKVRTVFWTDDVEEFVRYRFYSRQIFSLNATLIIVVPAEDFAIWIVLAQSLTFC
jgi:hypothetical protein